MERIFDTKAIGLVTTFENLTKVSVKDCIIGDNGVVYFVVDEGKIALAIGKNGESVKHVEKVIKKAVKVYEFSEDLPTLVRNIIPYVTNTRVKTNGKDAIVEVTVEKNHKALVIGRDGRNLELYKKLIMRNHGVSEIVVR